MIPLSELSFVKAHIICRVFADKKTIYTGTVTVEAHINCEESE